MQESKRRASMGSASTPPKRPKKLRGYKKALSRTRKSWYNMLQRCYNPKHVSYAEYGGRDIKVCAAWTPSEALGVTNDMAFTAFLKVLGVCPLNQTLDRINANGNYEPGNVRWATAQMQGINKRKPCKLVPHPTTGVLVPAATLARELGMSYQMLRATYIREGKWGIE